MKKFLFLIVALVGALAGAEAQQKVAETQIANITMAGGFNNGTDTTQRTWALATASGVTATSYYPLFFTRLDSVTHTGASNDSVWQRTPFYAHSVAFEIQAVQVGAVRCDSTKFYLYGSMSGQWPSGCEQLLTTFTMANTTNKQVFQYLANSGQGNPYTGYRLTAINGNLSTNSQAQWQGYMLIR